MFLNKNDLHNIKYILIYRIISIVVIIFACGRLMYALYEKCYGKQTFQEQLYNNEIIGASIVVLGMGYMLLNYLITIKKLKQCLDEKCNAK